MMTPKKRIAWKCRRGMLELDVVLERFMADGFDRLSDGEITTFEKLLDEQDPVLYSWFLGHQSPEDQTLCQLVDKIRENQ